MGDAVVLVCTVLMLFVYLWQARIAQSGTGQHDPDRFFLSTHAHSREEYGSTQTAYFLQMATVYPFFTFGFTGLWWLGLWNISFYIFGIILFSRLLPFCNRGLLDLIGQCSTPHALIARAHNTPALRVFASFLSMTAFVGLTLFETAWGTIALKAVLGGNDYLYYLSILVFALYLVVVLWTGGQRAVIKTTQIQLVLAYIGLHILTAWALDQQGGLGAVQAPIMFPLIFIAGSVAILKRLQNFRQGGSKQLMFLNIVAVISLAWVVYKIALTPDLLSVSTVRIPHIEVPNNMFWMLFTMAALPLFFQFVDMTNWQRLSSLSGDDTGLVIADAKKGLRFFLLESPLSWLFPIAIGMSAAAFLKVPEGKDAWVAFVDLVTSIPGKYGIFLAAVAVVGILSIFLSTAVSLLTASGYAFAYDVYPRTRVLMDTLHSKKAPEVLTEQERDSVVTVGVYATSVAILVSAVVYILFDLAFPELRMTLLYFFLTFYSPMLAFAPSILIPIRTGLAANGWVALCSMAVSAVLGLAIGIYSLFSSNEIWQWLGVPVCFLSSWVIYLGGFMFSRHAVNGPEAPHPAAA